MHAFSGRKTMLCDDLTAGQDARRAEAKALALADLSARINAIYRDATPDVEVYSIDESFSTSSALCATIAAR